jgi:hypothetical protein
MNLTLNDLTVNFAHLKRDSILSDWHWLIGKNRLPILITSFGEPFVQDKKDYSIYFLSVNNAELTRVADTFEQFKERLNDDDFLTKYFPLNAVGELRLAGNVLGKNQVYSCKLPLILGGEFTPENIEICDMEVHFSILGQIHKQVKDLPEGTKIGSIRLKKNGKSWWRLWG